MKDLDLKKDSIHKLFFNYAIPSMIGVCIFSLYTLVDCVFVSRYCGAGAVAAVELCSPVLIFFSCLSVIIGVGGNTLIGINFGKDDSKSAVEIFSIICTATLIISVVFTSLIFLYTDKIARFFGADNSCIGYVTDYLKATGIFAMFFMLSSILGLCVETMGKPVLSMLGNVVMASGNILFDYLFIVILHMGVKGAGLACGLSSFLSFLIYLFCFISKHSKLKLVKFNFKLNIVKQILFNGASEGISVISTGIVSYIYNLIIIKNEGADTLSSFAITLTIINFFGSVLIGLSQGLNPIVSVNYGAKKYKRVKSTVNIFCIYSVIASLVVSSLLILFHNNVLSLFKADNSQQVWEICKAYIPSLIVTPINVIIISYFTSINDAKRSALFSILRTLILRIIIVFVLCFSIGLSALWYSALVTELITMLMILPIYFERRRAYVEMA